MLIDEPVVHDIQLTHNSLNFYSAYQATWSWQNHSSIENTFFSWKLLYLYLSKLLSSPIAIISTIYYSKFGACLFDFQVADGIAVTSN